MSRTMGVTEFVSVSDMTRDDIAEQLDQGFNFWTHQQMIEMVRFLDQRIEELEAALHMGGE